MVYGGLWGWLRIAPFGLLIFLYIIRAETIWFYSSGNYIAVLIILFYFDVVLLVGKCWLGFAR